MNKREFMILKISPGNQDISSVPVFQSVPGISAHHLMISF